MYPIIYQIRFTRNFVFKVDLTNYEFGPLCRFEMLHRSIALKYMHAHGRRARRDTCSECRGRKGGKKNATPGRDARRRAGDVRDDDAVSNKVLSRRVAVVSPRQIHFREHLSS